MTTNVEAEIAALRLILSNVVARMVGQHEDGGRAILGDMGDQCKLAAEHLSAGPERTQLIRETQVYLDQFFKGITIT
jgi:hypothetical protein